ncbi:MAG: uncharacterized protein JWP46_2050 [Modestobacter sp.]|nr:uncharacterized protein [Modestobacter sp.]
MKYDEFITSVAELAGLTREEAESLTRASLRVLAQRLSGGEAEDLRAQLPQQLKEELVAPQANAQAFGVEEFARRVAEDVGSSEADAAAAVVAVLATLRKAVTPGEFDDVLSQLGREFAALTDADR